MKHEEKTLQTKKALAASLKKFMGTMPLNKITVRHLIEDCGLNRKTFYYHFSDIYDLLHWTLNDEAVEIVRHFDLMDDYEAAINFVMDYVEQNDHILNCALDSLGRDYLKQFFFKDFTDTIRSLVLEVEKMVNCTLDEPFRDFLCDFYTEALAGVLYDWIRYREKRDRQSTIEYVSFIMMESIPNIIMKRAGGK